MTGFTRTLWLALLMQLLAAAGTQADTRAIVGGNVVDIDSGDSLTDAVVLIEDERIAAIGERGEVDIPEGADIVNASGMWLVPGLMNMHVHLGLILPGKMEAELANESPEALSLRMMRNAQGALDAGVTTIRMPGEHARGDMAV